MLISRARNKMGKVIRVDNTARLTIKWPSHCSPVFDPRGPYGLGVVSKENEEELKNFIEEDPASKLNKFEYYLMLAIVANQNT